MVITYIRILRVLIVQDCRIGYYYIPMFEQRGNISVFNKLRRGRAVSKKQLKSSVFPNVSTKLLSKQSGDVAAVFFRNWYIHSSVSKIILPARSISKGVLVLSYVTFGFNFHEQSSITATISAIIKKSALRFFFHSVTLLIDFKSPSAAVSCPRR